MMLRRSLAVLLAVAALAFGSPIVGIAQSLKTATLNGDVVDPSGRGVGGVRVELMSDNTLVSTTTTLSDGRFWFNNVAAGNYTVRTFVNGQPAGVRASVVPGVQPSSAMIVLPSLAQAKPAVVVMAALTQVAGVMTVAVTQVANAVVISGFEQKDLEKVQAVVADLQRHLAFIEEVTHASPNIIFTIVPPSSSAPGSGTQ